MSELIAKISEVYKKVSHAAMRVGRNPEEVKVLAVTKTVHAERVLEVVEAGIRLIGENRVQEAERKIEILKDKLPDTVEWHMIGHLQKNKAKKALRLFDMIQSLDSIELAERLNRFAEEIGKKQRVLIEVKLSEEETKTGVEPSALTSLYERVLEMKNLILEGLMTIPPFFSDPEDTRPYFRRLRELRDEMDPGRRTLKELSMGMSNDYEVAVEEGATIVRIGTAIFGPRRY